MSVRVAGFEVRRGLEKATLVRALEELQGKPESLRTPEDKGLIRAVKDELKNNYGNIEPLRPQGDGRITAGGKMYRDVSRGTPEHEVRRMIGPGYEKARFEIV